MADYVDALHARHFDDHAEPAARAAAVHDLMRAHEVRLLQPLLDYLGARNDIRLLGPRRAEARAPTVAVETGRPGVELAERLAPHGIMAGGGDFYAGAAASGDGGRPGPKGVLRLSFVHYTSPAEVDRLIEALDHVLQSRG
jgi:selenocysteine lyase/cysteine desulfurase